MKKTSGSRAQPQRKRPGAADKQAAAAPAVKRRSVLAMLRNGAIAAAVLGGSGWYVAAEVSATLDEHDLSAIGNGIPAIVQVHDPQCPLCRALQVETRRALRDFPDGALQYRIANITTASGSAFAGRYGVGHVTLLLFDGAGEMKRVIRGPSHRDLLRDAFAAHLRAASGG